MEQVKKSNITTCNIKESEFCTKRCNDKICSKTPIIVKILTSDNKKKVKNLLEVMTKFDLKVGDYV